MEIFWRLVEPLAINSIIFKSWILTVLSETHQIFYQSSVLFYLLNNKLEPPSSYVHLQAHLHLPYECGHLDLNVSTKTSKVLHNIELPLWRLRDVQNLNEINWKYCCIFCYSKKSNCRKKCDSSFCCISSQEFETI